MIAPAKQAISLARPPWCSAAVAGWGGAHQTHGQVARPSRWQDLHDVFAQARAHGLSVGLRGGGCSYGDAACNDQNVVLDLSALRRITAFDAQSGLVTLEPGVTIDQLWRHVLPDGWWPPVVTGTSRTTLGGGVAMNAHGKNAGQVGPIGAHVQDFELLLPDGSRLTCSRKTNADIFHAAIGGFGMLGVFKSLTLQLRRVDSGLVDVGAFAAHNLEEMFDIFGANERHADYLVGWVDGFARGAQAGRGQVHCANYVPAGENTQDSLTIDQQTLPTHMAGLMPRSEMWRVLRLLCHRPGMSLLNRLKYAAARHKHGFRFRQPLVHFSFLLDSLPGWKRCYGPGGLLQYQAFVPADRALPAFDRMLRLQHSYKLPTFLGVLKRHKPDEFLMSHGLDGYSFAQDFPVTRRNRARLREMCAAMDEIVLGAGGRFYFAKDSTLRPQIAQAYLGEQTISRFRELKARLDPENLLQTDLWRRLFAQPPLRTPADSQRSAIPVSRFTEPIPQ